jgi:anti-sigma28 factor (negative regulator of flagellin synthesis)
MARIAALMELQPAARRKSLEVRNDQGRDASPNDDGLMEQILENMRSTPWEEVLKRIACSPQIRRGKVLSIRRQITEGTYEIEDRVDGAIDGVLEAITCPLEKPYLDSDVRSAPATLVAC